MKNKLCFFCFDYAEWYVDGTLMNNIRCTNTPVCTEHMNMMSDTLKDPVIRLIKPEQKKVKCIHENFHS